MRADENKRLGEFMDAFVSRSGSASEERKAAEAISVSTATLLILDMMDICNALVMVQSAIDSLENLETLLVTLFRGWKKLRQVLVT